MNHKLFLDSWGIISIYNNKEQYHFEACKYYDKCLDNSFKIFTTNFVVSETISFLYRKISHEKSKIIIDNLFDQFESGYITLIEIDYEKMKKALELRYKLKDKPKISFIDLTSMIVMEEHGIKEILTMDKHFLQANMGLELRPSLAS